MSRLPSLERPTPTNMLNWAARLWELMNILLRRTDDLPSSVVTVQDLIDMDLVNQDRLSKITRKR